MSQPADQYPALEAARAQVARLQKARERLDAAWAPLRRVVTTTASVLVGIPAATIVGYLAAGSLGEGAVPVLAFGTLLGTPLLTYTGLRVIQWCQQRISPTEALRLRIAERCVELGTLPPEVARPLDSAVDAFFTMARLAADPDWHTGAAGKDLLPKVAARLEELLDWGRRLKLIGTRLHALAPGAAAHPEHRETLAQYQAQCQALAQAANLFVQAEAKMTRAFAAISADRSMGSRAADQLHEVTATLDALSEVISPTELLEVRLPAPAREEETPLHAGVGQQPDA
jgi:hypothetical protein